MKKIKLYLDTSIISAFYDYSKPVRQLITQKWFENDSMNFNLFASVITIQEVEEFQNIEKKEKIKQLILNFNIDILEITESAKILANEYIKHGAIPKSEPEDALHIAIPSIYKIDALASWNFKHIVSLNPIKKIHEINQAKGFINIEISSLELFGGAKYGNL
ncbi:MAG: PIN domain-containing protein [Candidatus Margulisiibacteriota bacterium]|jgi:predicted nucleic acid-binding protein